MKHLFFAFLLITYFSSTGQNFKNEQLKFNRVKIAEEEKWDTLKKEISSKGFDPNKFKIHIRVYKLENKLEVWISKFEKEEFKLLKEYKVAASSGELGPKRKEGDLQVPEGFYKIDVFNPTSDFYLSLGINYPNQSDKIKGGKKLGGDIYIHGSNVTIGCVPITDEKIKELYILAVEAKNCGQNNIYVTIFPFQLESKKLETFKTNQNFTFWKSLEKGYSYFNKNKKLPFVKIDQNGDYLIE